MHQNKIDKSSTDLFKNDSVCVECHDWISHLIGQKWHKKDSYHFIQKYVNILNDEETKSRQILFTWTNQTKPSCNFRPINKPINRISAILRSTEYLSEKIHQTSPPCVLLRICLALVKFWKNNSFQRSIFNQTQWLFN